MDKPSLNGITSSRTLLIELHEQAWNPVLGKRQADLVEIRQGTDRRSQVGFATLYQPH